MLWISLLLLATSSGAASDCPFQVLAAQSRYETSVHLEIRIVAPPGTTLIQRSENSDIVVERAQPGDPVCWTAQTLRLRPDEVENARAPANLGKVLDRVLWPLDGQDSVLPAGHYRACVEYLVRRPNWREWTVRSVCSASFEILTPTRYTRFDGEEPKPTRPRPPNGTAVF